MLLLIISALGNYVQNFFLLLCQFISNGNQRSYLVIVIYKEKIPYRASNFNEYCILYKLQKFKKKVLKKFVTLCLRFEPFHLTSFSKILNT